MQIYYRFLTAVVLIVTNIIQLSAFDAPTPFAFGVPTLIFDVAGTDIGDQFRYSNVTPGLDAIATVTGTNITTEANVNLVHEGTDDLRVRLTETPGAEEIAWITYNLRIVDAGTTTTISTPIAHAEILFSDLDGFDNRPGLSDFAGIQSDDFSTVSLDMNSKLKVRTDLINGYHVGIFDDGQFGMVDEGQEDAIQSLYMVQFDLYNVTEFDVTNGYLTFDTDTEDIGGFDYSRHVEMDMNGDYELQSPVLSVELLSFEARKERTDIKLEWETAQELNNSHFEVEYALDGKNFQLLTQVMGNGTVSEISKYHATHFNINEITNHEIYYRLKQVDFNGSFEDSKTIVVNLRDSKLDELSIYPNLVHTGEVVYITFTNEQPSDNYLISMYNPLGAKVIEYQYDGSGFLSIPNSLSTGFYLLTVYSKKQNHLVKRRIILAE